MKLVTDLGFHIREYSDGEGGGVMIPSRQSLRFSQYVSCIVYPLLRSDESFTNPSLGNCMDYTNWPEENMHPDESNYKRLASLYGTVGRRRLGNSKETRRTDRRRLPEDLRNVYEDTVAEIELLSTRRSLSTNAAGSHWVLEEDTSHGSKYSRYLGEDYSIEVHLLHTQPLN
jgi:hypothetical protein